MAILDNLSGWNEWTFLHTLRGGYAFPSSSFPMHMLPANSFWPANFQVHCRIPVPWTSVLDPGTAAYATGGPSSGTLAGALVGLDRAYRILAEPNNIVHGIGREDGIGPYFGFCIGDTFYEHQYFYLTVLRTAPFVITYEYYTDILERGRLRRMYIDHGDVKSYTSITINDKSTKYLLEIDINEEIQSVVKLVEEGAVTLSGTIKVIKADGSGEVILTLDGTITGDGKLGVIPPKPTLNSEGVEVPPPSPSSGDFFIMSSPWCVEDPYMMTGFWMGVEGGNSIDVPVSGKNFFKTNKNVPYIESEIVGIYIYKDVDTGEVIAPAANSTMYDSGTRTWAWWYLNKSSEIWKDESKRWKEGNTFVNLESGSMVTGRDLERVLSWGMEDISLWDKTNANYYRIELSKGGSSARNNFHAPILIKCWVKQDDHFFKIIGQPECNIIDVAKKDISGKYEFDPLFKKVEITNQYSWMLNEFYHGSGPIGIYGTNVKSSVYDAKSNSTKIVLTSFDTPGVTRKPTKAASLSFSYLNPNCFYRRFRDDYYGIGPIKLWKKFDRWKFMVTSQQTFDIVDISWPVDGGETPAEYVEYETHLTVKGDASKEIWGHVIFDEPYIRRGGMNGLLIGSVKDAFNTVPILCLDYQWRGAIIKDLNIPNGTVIGVCGGGLWGLDFTAISPNSIAMAVTTPSGGLCTSAIWNNTRFEDWVAFTDLETRKLNIRRGTLSFRQEPRKIEVSMGHPEMIYDIGDVAEGAPIKLDTAYDRVKLLSFDIPSALNSSQYGTALTFRQGDIADWYGTIVSGSGNVDFQALRRLGLESGEISSAMFKRGDYFISPLYIYKRAENVQGLTNMSVDWGVSTEDGPLYIMNGSVKNVQIEYVKDEQTLEDIGRYDMHRLNDGEVLLVYSKDVNDFTSENGINNETGKWSTKKCVFVAGSANNARLFGCPNVKDLKFNNDTRYENPLMVLNSCELLGSIYDSFRNVLNIFYVTNHGQQFDFVGCYRISLPTMHVGTNLCKENSSGKKLLVRPIALSSEILSSPTSTYTHEDNYLKGILPVDGVNDSIVRIMGVSSTNSLVKTFQNPVLGTPGFKILNDGTYVMLYNNEEGIRMAYSDSAGLLWIHSDIILARNGKAPCVIDEKLIAYILPEGLAIKYFTSNIGIKAAVFANELTSSNDVPEGDIASYKEEIQRQFDQTEVGIVGSGQIDEQRLSGYEDGKGFYKIFYYTSDGALTCSQSTDTLKWVISPNF